MPAAVRRGGETPPRDLGCRWRVRTSRRPFDGSPYTRLVRDPNTGRCLDMGQTCVGFKAYPRGWEPRGIYRQKPLMRKNSSVRNRTLPLGLEVHGRRAEKAMPSKSAQRTRTALAAQSRAALRTGSSTAVSCHPVAIAGKLIGVGGTEFPVIEFLVASLLVATPASGRGSSRTEFHYGPLSVWSECV
jgi:hypothetical protein